MVDITNTISNTGQGTVQQLRRGERLATTYIETQQAEHPRIGSFVTQLRDTLATTAETLAARAPDLTHSGFQKVAGEQVASRITPAFKAVQAALPSAKANLDGREAPFAVLRFPDEQPPAVRVEQRQYARSLPLPKLIEATQDDPALAVAVLEGGAAMSGLPSDVFERLREEMIVANAARNMANSSNYRTSATADDPIGNAPDHAAARAAGAKLIGAFRAERELLNGIPTMLAHVVTAVAIMLDTDRDEAFAVLTAS